jgi:nicotinamide-nucleotide amidase
MLVEKIEEIVGSLLAQRNLTLAVAESCTGGLVGHMITNVPGSSAYFLGGVLAYSNQTKENLLGVNNGTIEKYGAVSQETVLEMADGVRKHVQANIGLSVSGIAGPEGGTPEKPVGLVWIGLSTLDFAKAQSFNFPGNRSEVKQQSAEQALQILYQFLSAV